MQPSSITTRWSPSSLIAIAGRKLTLGFANLAGDGVGNGREQNGDLKPSCARRLFNRRRGEIQQMAKRLTDDEFLRLCKTVLENVKLEHYGKSTHPSDKHRLLEIDLLLEELEVRGQGEPWFK